MAGGYRALRELVEHELVLARAGQWEDLAAADQARADLVASLPSPPPATARLELLAASRVQAQLVAVLTAAREEAARELAHLARGRGAARGYGAA